MHAFVYYKHIERLSCQCLGVFSRKKTFFRGIANMSLNENYVRRNCIPIIYTKGTHYEVGFDVGKTFASMIQDYLENSISLKNDLLPAYKTPEGLKAYEDTLECLKKNFPQYIRELEGTADGAKVSFQKLFLLHMDRIVTYAAGNKNIKEPIGCTDIFVNYSAQGQEILGHNEDGLAEVMNHAYFVSAHIISETPQGKWNTKEERFTALCYAGHLPGYFMNANHHGLIFSLNTLSAKDLYPGKTPRHFITRALLAAENLEQAKEIIRDKGVGAADGCGINLTFLEDRPRTFYNIETAPAENDETKMDILPIGQNQSFSHCNTYLRLRTEEDDLLLENSTERIQTLKKNPVPVCKEDVVSLLGNTSSNTHRIFQEFGKDDDVKTITTGIFDCVNLTWSIYADNPAKSEPLFTIPLTTGKKAM